MKRNCLRLPAIRDGRLDFAIGTLSAEMKLQDLHVEPLFESEFVLVASKSRTCTGTTTLESLKNEQWVLPQTNMGTTASFLLRYKEMASVLKTSLKPTQS